MICLKLFGFKHRIFELHHLEVYCRTTFFSNSVVHISMLVAIVRQKDEIIFVLFQQSTMYKIPPVFSYHSFKINSDQLYLDIKEYLQETFEPSKIYYKFLQIKYLF